MRASARRRGARSPPLTASTTRRTPSALTYARQFIRWLAGEWQPTGPRGGNADQVEPPRNERPAVATPVRQGALTLKLGRFYRAPSAARWR